MRKQDKKLDILYVGTLPPHNGGTAIVGSMLLHGLASAGHTIRAVAPAVQSSSDSLDFFARSHPELSVSRIFLPYFETSPDSPPPEEYRRKEGEQILNELRRLFAERRPDLVLIGRETFALHVPDFVQGHSVPCILLIQGGTTAGILKKTIPEAMAAKYLEQFRKTDLIIVVAWHLAEKIRQLGMNHTIVIENAIDVEKFSPKRKNQELLKEFHIGEDEIVVAHVSNLKPLKRPFDFIQAAETTLRQFPSLIFLIVGDGILKEEMKTACLKLGLQDRFRFTGWVDYDRVPDFINLSELVVMPSEMEARALVYLETQSCGRVLIASDISSAQEVIQDGRTGLLFPKGNVESLASKILLAARNAKLRSEIGRNARTAALNRPLTSFLEDYETAIQQVVQKQPNFR